MFIPRRSTTKTWRASAKGSPRTSPHRSSSSCTEEVTYKLCGGFEVNKETTPTTTRGGEAEGGAATEPLPTAAEAAVVAAPPPPHLNLQSRAKERAKRADEEEWRREVRIAGAPAAAEVAVLGVVAADSRVTRLRRRYKAECAFGEAGCRYWEIHDRGIEWQCAPI